MNTDISATLYHVRGQPLFFYFRFMVDVQKKRKNEAAFIIERGLIATNIHPVSSGIVECFQL